MAQNLGPTRWTLPYLHRSRRNERFRSPLEIQWRRYACTWKWRSEKCNNFYRIERQWKCGEWCWWIEDNFLVVEITKFIGLPKRILSRTRSSKLVTYLLFKVTQKVPSFPSISIFTSVGNHFVCKYPNTRRELCTINMTGTFTRWLLICCVWMAASRTTKNWMLAWNTSCHVRFTLHAVDLRICCKIAKLAGSFSEVRTGQLSCRLSSFFQWTMMSSSVCPLRGNGENIQRHWDHWMSYADIWSFRDCLESD